VHLLRDSDAMTIYIGCPEDRSRAMAEFYRDLLELQLYEPYGDLCLQRRPPLRRPGRPSLLPVMEL